MARTDRENLGRTTDCQARFTHQLMSSERGIALRAVKDRIESARSLCTLSKKPINLVAISKTKSPIAILDVYREGHRTFGENYIQELAGKVPQVCSLFLYKLCELY